MAPKWPVGKQGVNDSTLKRAITNSRYIDVKDPIGSKLLFLSPIRSRKGTYSLKTRHGGRKDCKYVLMCIN